MCGVIGTQLGTPCVAGTVNGLASNLPERQRAGFRPSAFAEIIAARIERSHKVVPDDLVVRDALVDFCEFGSGLRLKSGVAGSVMVPSHLQKLSRLMKSEAEPLGRLDDPKNGDRTRRIQPVTAGTAVRLGQ